MYGKPHGWLWTLVLLGWFGGSSFAADNRARAARGGQGADSVNEEVAIAARELQEFDPTVPPPAHAEATRPGWKTVASPDREVELPPYQDLEVRTPDEAAAPSRPEDAEATAGAPKRSFWQRVVRHWNKPRHEAAGVNHDQAACAATFTPDDVSAESAADDVEGRAEAEAVASVSVEEKSERLPFWHRLFRGRTPNRAALQDTDDAVGAEAGAEEAEAAAEPEAEAGPEGAADAPAPDAAEGAEPAEAEAPEAEAGAAGEPKADAEEDAEAAEADAAALAAEPEVAPLEDTPAEEYEEFAAPAAEAFAAETRETTEKSDAKQAPDRTVPKASGEQLKRIKELVTTIKIGGAYAKQSAAKNELISMGAMVAPEVIPLVDDRVPLVRVLGVIILRETGSPLAYPVLWRLLDDENGQIRYHAVLALRELTGERHGFYYNDIPENRAKAKGRWQEFLVAQGYMKPPAKPEPKSEAAAAAATEGQSIWDRLKISLTKREQAEEETQTAVPQKESSFREKVAKRIRDVAPEQVTKRIDTKTEKDFPGGADDY